MKVLSTAEWLDALESMGREERKRVEDREQKIRELEMSVRHHQAEYLRARQNLKRGQKAARRNGADFDPTPKLAAMGRHKDLGRKARAMLKRLRKENEHEVGMAHKNLLARRAAGSGALGGRIDVRG